VFGLQINSGFSNTWFFGELPTLPLTNKLRNPDWSGLHGCALLTYIAITAIQVNAYRSSSVNFGFFLEKTE